MSTRQPAEQITDRAKRYRANSDVGDMPRVCMFCAATSDLQVDHLDGFEEHGEAENLIILCRSCNQLKSSVFKAAGLGRRTEQYNPFLGLFSEGGLLGGRTTHTHTGRAIKKMKTRVKHERHAARREELGIRGREGRESDRHYRELSEMVSGGMSLKDALREIGNPSETPVIGYKGVMIYRRGPAADSAYFVSLDPATQFDRPMEAKAAVDAFKNPAANYSGWSHAVGVLRGEIEGSPRRAAAVIRSTPPGRRLAFLESMRENPGAKTMGAFVNALMISKGDVPGDRDAAVKLIHETPTSRRAEFQREIWQIRKDRYGPGGRQDSLPF